jgi:hypothetical protein
MLMVSSVPMRPVPYRRGSAEGLAIHKAERRQVIGRIMRPVPEQQLRRHHYPPGSQARSGFTRLLSIGVIWVSATA